VSEGSNSAWSRKSQVPARALQGPVPVVGQGSFWSLAGSGHCQGPALRKVSAPAGPQKSQVSARAVPGPVPVVDLFSQLRAETFLQGRVCVA